MWSPSPSTWPRRGCSTPRPSSVAATSGRPTQPPSRATSGVRPDPVWVGSIAIRLGELHVGIRSDDAAVVAAIRRLYADRIVDDDRAHEDFGISVSAPTHEGARPIPFLAHGCRPMLRSRSVPRLVRALDHHLYAIEHPIVDGVVRMHRTAAIVLGDQAVLVPEQLVARGRATDHALRERGLAVADAPSPLLDPLHATVVVPEGPAGAGGSDPAEPILAPPGTYQLAAFHWQAHDTDADETGARALMRLLHHMRGTGGLDGQTLLEALVSLLERTPQHGLDASARGWDSVTESLRAG
jgi:hypothetical protein